MFKAMRGQNLQPRILYQERLSFRFDGEIESFTGFPCGSTSKESAYNAGDLGLENPWRRERLSTPVFWPGEFHGLCSVLYSPWGHRELDTTEKLSL